MLVSDSGTKRIYRLEDGVMRVWTEDPLLAAVNGILVEPDRLVIATMSGRVLAMDPSTRKIIVLAQGVADGDGVAGLGDGRYLVSEWPGLLYVMASDGAPTTLIDSRKAGSYINDILLVGDVLYLPHMKPGSLEALRVGR